MGLVLAFAELAGAVLLLTAAITGATLAEVVSGEALASYRREEQASTTQATSSTRAPSSSTGATAPASASEQAWIRALLASLHAPATSANMSSLTNWIQRETTWSSAAPDGALYTNNPLNTTEPGFDGVSLPGSTAGVKRYPTATEGIAATIAVLRGYPAIVAALRSGQGLTGGGAIAGELSTWSDGGYSSV